MIHSRKITLEEKPFPEYEAGVCRCSARTHGILPSAQPSLSGPDLEPMGGGDQSFERIRRE